MPSCSTHSLKYTGYNKISESKRAASFDQFRVNFTLTKIRLVSSHSFAIFFKSQGQTFQSIIWKMWYLEYKFSYAKVNLKLSEQENLVTHSAFSEASFISFCFLNFQVAISKLNFFILSPLTYREGIVSARNFPLHYVFTTEKY